MTNAILASLLGAGFFALAGYGGALLGRAFAERITPFADGPPQEHAPVLILGVACSAVGALVAPHASTSAMLMIALVCFCLVAVWITDAHRGIVPDAFTLGPLAIMLAVALQQRQMAPFLLSATVPFVPFALAALLTHGRGMGWGDVKLAALGGAVLGPQLSLLAFVFACLAAAGINYARRRNHGPIAFAPYMAASIGLAIPLGRAW
jgi:prepilin signal peptidase PulO-like enzyme (type II secretory pathway)